MVRWKEKDENVHTEVFDALLLMGYQPYGNLISLLK